MKAGDKVKVIDGSWSLSIKNNKLEHISGNELTGYGEHTIIDVECDLPGYKHLAYQERNNTIIKSRHGVLTFIQARFLAPIDRYCPTCGHKVNWQSTAPLA